MPAAEAALPPPRARHPLVQRVLDPDAPEAVRLGAARGGLPIPPIDLAYAQVRLLSDPSPAVEGAARDSLQKLQADALLSFFRDPDCDPVLLDHFARSGRLGGDPLAAAIAHPSIPDDTLDALAASGDAATLGLIVTNEVRIIARPVLLTTLRSNPRLTIDLRRRLAELERDFVGRDPIRLRAVEPAAEAPAAGADLAVPEDVEASATDAPPEGGEATPAFDPLQEQQYEESLRQTDAYQRILRLDVAQRSLLAMKGNAEERAILIRDTARTVAQTVLKNPRLSEGEIATFAGMRNIHEDILRTLAGNREWTKSYGVVHALVRNPKTPPGLSVQFLARLGTRDLKIAMGDKNIPELVRRNARNLFLARTQPAKKLGKKAH
jgi:hypothetical protein